ncbi:MAG: BppU family phage baseplate upper protein [Angelakisella sp.]|nr:BppU family phage baseplate upper protein [Angelakisella sp.]
MENYQIEQRIKIDFAYSGVPPRVYAKQYDNNMRVVAVDLYNNGVPYIVPAGYSVNIRMEKLDGHHVYNPALFGTGNTVFAILTQQMLTHPGELMAEMEVVQAENVLKTATFMVVCVPSMIPPGEIESTDEYKTLQELSAQALAAAKSTEESAREAEASQSAAAESAETASSAATSAAENSESAQAAALQAAASAAAAAESAEQAAQMAVGAKGWYADPESLQVAYPAGQNGWWAIVGTTDTIWTWDSDTEAWTDSGDKTDLSKYPAWADLAGKLLVPCNCIYEDGTHAITKQSAKQDTGAQYTIVMVPTHDYTAGDAVTIAGEAVAVKYQASDAAVQTGAWLAGRPVQAEVFGGTLYLAANQPSQGGDGNVTMADGAEITVPEDWGPGPWKLELTEDEEAGSAPLGPNVAGYVGEIVYFADSILRENHVWADGKPIDTEQWPELAEYAAKAGWRRNEAMQYIVPDLRGRFLLGASEGRSVGTVGGEETHILTQSEMPRHNHMEILGYEPGNDPYAFAWQSLGHRTPETLAGAGHTSMEGLDQPHNNMPPYYVVVPQIRAKVDVVYAKMPESIPAGDVIYDNTGSGLQAETVQGAVDEVAGRTDGLINIDDVTISFGDGWEIYNHSIEVKNGILCGFVLAVSEKPRAFTPVSNYNIKGRIALGIGMLDDGIFAPLAIDMDSTTYIDRWLQIWAIISIPWDPTWTKKEAR